MDVHLRQLRYFVGVAEHLHFGQAAQQLFVSQPSLSKQIRALESQLRTPLFHRDRRGARLTAAGDALLPVARSLLAQWTVAEAAVAAAAATTQATLVVGMSTGLGRGLLPAVRTRLGVLAPEARLQLRQVSWDDPTGGLAAPDGTDAALVWLPLPDPARFDWTTVAVEPLLVAMPAQHRLAAQAAVDISELAREAFLALPSGCGPSRDFWLAADLRPEHPVIVGAEVGNAEETVEALTSGLGICLLAAGNAPLVTRDGVLTRPVTGVPPAELVLAWRAGDDRPLLRHLRTSLGQVLCPPPGVDPSARTLTRPRPGTVSPDESN
jgi:DNA-binding transcriptional LysR family regulator